MKTSEVYQKINAANILLHEISNGLVKPLDNDENLCMSYLNDKLQAVFNTANHVRGQMKLIIKTERKLVVK